ncbi:hemicentin-1-like [Galleria mellonella]|uniref:Hemicentin-1-like n=1 Tax=Galleria mellonella TaxID=7137 RepID=A0ABM3MVL4_GALME|nr:hemicentin-1-like [Galleria mellonella]
MGVYDALLLIAALPALAGPGWCSVEVVTVAERAGGREFRPQFTGQSAAVVAAVGQNASLVCEIYHLGNKSVSWVRSRDLQILSHAGVVFTADSRVSASVAGDRATSRHLLHVARLRTGDSGRYECQINTDPKMSMFFNLTVLDEPVPQTVVELQGPAEVTAALGSTVTLRCEARYEPPPRRLPLPALDIHWFKDDQPINLQSAGGGGGVLVDTRRGSARAESRLQLRAADGAAGRYTCRAAGRRAAVTLRHAPHAEGEVEAMQRDQAAAATRLALHAAPLLLAIALRLLHT